MSTTAVCPGDEAPAITSRTDSVPGRADADSTARASSPERGLRWLRTRTYLPPDFDREVFAELWTVWPEPWRTRAREASPLERRTLALSRYGLIEQPEGVTDPLAPTLGYVDDGRGGWVMNCLACHTGKVAGHMIWGAPNTHVALQTLTDDVRLVKLQQHKRLGHLELGSLKIPLGTTNGSTNAVVFGVALGALRDRDLNVIAPRQKPEFVHHDMDAPAFWNVRKKRRLYCDAFAARQARPLLQFVMLPENGPEVLKSWEREFADILAWIESLPVPPYPFPIDRSRAAAGKVIFERHCAICHGTYGEGGKYPNRIVPLDEVGTDAVRLGALTVEHRRMMRDGWFGHYGQDDYIIEPDGYLAPPLDGLWASAPYFHNGSVPTLWDVLHPAERPPVWRRTESGYDQTRVGLEVNRLERVPTAVRLAADRRTYFDTRAFGKTAQGHDFANDLTDPDRQALLEYLKTL